MKNLINQKEFKKNNLNDNFNINEAAGSGMDFSNRIGWSESLLGRAINKIFSFGAFMYEKKVLTGLKQELDDQYLRGILRALADFNVNASDITSANNMMLINIKLINKNTKSEITDFSIIDQINKYEIRIPDTEKIENYILEITPDNENCIVTPSKIENITSKDIECEVKDKNGKVKKWKIEILTFSEKRKDSNVSFNVVIKDIENGKIINEFSSHVNDTYIYKIDKSPEKYTLMIITISKNAKIKHDDNIYDNKFESDLKSDQKEIKFTIISESEDEKDFIIKLENVNDEVKPSNGTEIMLKYNNKSYIIIDDNKPLLLNQKEFINNILIDIEKDIENKNIKDVDYSLFDLLKNKVQEEIDNLKNLNDEQKTQFDLKDEQINIMIEFLEEIKTSIDEKINKIKNDVNTSKKIDYDKFNKLLDTPTEKLLSSGNVPVINDNNKQIKNYINNISNTVKIKNINDYSKACNDIFNKLNNYNIDKDKIQVIKNKAQNNIKNLNSSQLKVKLTEIVNDINNIINEGYEYNNYELLTERKVSINKAFSDMKSDNKLKHAMDLYGDINVLSLDPQKIFNLFQKNPDLRNKAIKYVDKEALKEIQLRAEWVYDTEKYKDKRSDVYSRVNFTTTENHKKKLENLWKRYVMDVKSVYRDFYMNDSGYIPKDIDPFYLVKNDMDFTDKFNNYSKSELNEYYRNKKQINPIDRTNVYTNTTEELKEILKVSVVSKLNDGSIGLIRISEISTLNGEDGNYILDMAFIAEFNNISNYPTYRLIKAVDYEKIYDSYTKLKNENNPNIETVMKDVIKNNSFNINKVDDSNPKLKILCERMFLHEKDEHVLSKNNININNINVNSNFGIVLICANSMNYKNHDQRIVTNTYGNVLLLNRNENNWSAFLSEYKEKDNIQTNLIKNSEIKNFNDNYHKKGEYRIHFKHSEILNIKDPGHWGVEQKSIGLVSKKMLENILNNLNNA
jgi:hypothetical protein